MCVYTSELHCWFTSSSNHLSACSASVWHLGTRIVLIILGFLFSWLIGSIPCKNITLTPVHWFTLSSMFPSIRKYLNYFIIYQTCHPNHQPWELIYFPHIVKTWNEMVRWAIWHLIAPTALDQVMKEGTKMCWLIFTALWMWYIRIVRVGRIVGWACRYSSWLIAGILRRWIWGSKAF